MSALRVDVAVPQLLFRELILHAVTTAFENDRFGVMEEPIQNGTGWRREQWLDDIGPARFRATLAGPLA